MLQQDEPADYVVATGETHSIREFLDIAFGYVNLDWHDYVAFDPRYLRPTEVDLLIGEPSKARTKLNWQPSVDFNGLVELMVKADLLSVGMKNSDVDPDLVKDKVMNNRSIGVSLD